MKRIKFFESFEALEAPDVQGTAENIHENALKSTEQIKREIKMTLENVASIGLRDPKSDEYQEKMTDYIMQLFDQKNDKDGWEEKLQRAYTEIWKTQMYPMSQKGKPKADNILKREFPFLK